jgi:hypothetical protein
MELRDLPAGFVVEPEEEGDDGGLTVSSKDARCAPLARLMNADSPPGSRAVAARSFSGGQEGPFIDEQLDAMASAQAVAALQRSFRTAIRSCRTLTVKVPGEGTSTMNVREASAPEFGASPVAVRFTASSGPLEGLEITMVTTGVEDAVLALTLVAATPEDVDGATETAVTKAKAILTGKSGT